MPDRIVRDELLTSERYWSCSIQAQQFYVHLLLVVDDAARFSGKNFSLRAACFPGRPMEPAAMEKMLIELADADLIRIYMSQGERFLFVPRFNNRRRYVSSSKFPAPPNEINDLPEEKSALSQTQVNPKSGGVGVGVGVGVGKTGSVTHTSVGAPCVAKATPKRGSRLPEDWQLPKTWGNWALGKYPAWTAEKVRDEALKFRNHWVSTAGRAGTKLDWYATWQNWCMSSIAHKDDHRSQFDRSATVPGAEAWKPPPAMSAEEKAAADEVRRRVLPALKRVPT